jgi:hypothetical protein
MRHGDLHHRYCGHEVVVAYEYEVVVAMKMMAVKTEE